MEKPWSTPITKTGRSAIVPQGPWHYAFTCIAAHIAVEDPNALENIVPKPLSVHDGQVWLYITEIISTSESKPELNVEVPDLLQYREAAVFIKVSYNGSCYAYCPFMWVDRDLPLMRGYIAGWPKKLAYIELTKLHPLLPRYSRLSPGLKLGGFAQRSGYHLFTIKVTLERQVSELPLDSFGPFALPRYFPSLFGLSGVSEIVVFEPEYLRYGEIWRGSCELKIEGGINDELEHLKKHRVLAGYYYTVALKPKRLRLLAKLEL